MKNKQQCQEILKKFKELENFFKNLHISDNKIKLDESTYITNLKHFINCHLSFIKNNIQKKTVDVYIERLEKLRDIMELNNI